MYGLRIFDTNLKMDNVLFKFTREPWIGDSLVGDLGLGIWEWEWGMEIGIR